LVFHSSTIAMMHGPINISYSNIKFHENPLSGCWVIPCGRTDKHDEANSRFS